MKEPCSSEMLAGPHTHPAFRPFSSHPSYQLSPASRTALRRRGLSAVLAARKAAAEAPSAEADAASTQKTTTLPTGRRKDIREVPSWMAWDRDALKEQEEALVQFQQSRFVAAKPETAVRARNRSSGRSFTTDFKSAVNTDDFKKAIADTGNDVDYAYYCNGDVQWFGVHVADPDIKRAGFVTKWLGFAAQSLGRVQKGDGSIVDREIETWLPKKKVKAFSLRSKKMGTRTIAYQDGQVVFFKAVMDNALGKYLNAGLPDTSGKYNDREARNEGKITGFLDEVQGQTAYQSFKQKMIKNREIIPKPLDPWVIQEVEEWVQTKEEWDREKVYLAELGYIPDEADPEAWPKEDENTKDEEAVLSGKTRSRRQPKEELSDEVREFAERAFQAAKKEAAALDAGGWNVGSVITDKKDRNRFAVVRTPRGPRIERGRKGGFADRQSSRQEGPEDRAYREPRQDRAGWATSPASKWATSETPQWSEQATGGQDDLLWDEPEKSSQPAPVPSQPTGDDLVDAWASLTDESDEMVNAAPQPDEREDDRLRGFSEQTALKTPPAPRQRAGLRAGADAWGSRRGEAAQRGPAQRGAARPPQRDAGAPRKSGWTTSGDEYSGWTEGDDVAPAGPQGWATSDDWVDDSAAAAGRFFEAGKKPARPGSQGWATGGWSESAPIVADEDVDSWSEFAESMAKGQDRKFSRGGFSEDLTSLSELGDSSNSAFNSDLDNKYSADRPGVDEDSSQGYQQPAIPARQRLPEWSRYEGSAGEVVRGEDAGRRRRRAAQPSPTPDESVVAPSEQEDPSMQNRLSSGLVDDTPPEMGNWDEWEAFMASDQATKEFDPEDAADAEELFATSEAVGAAEDLTAEDTEGQKQATQSKSRSRS